MMLERLLTGVNKIVLAELGRHLTELEIAILTGAWNNQTYEEIAAASGYSLNYLQRDAAPKFWKLLSRIMGRQLNKTNASAILMQMITHQDQAVTASSIEETEKAGEARELFSSSPLTQIDWGEAIDVSIFYGRTQELNTLIQWIRGASLAGGQHLRCRLVALLGMGGIGKSSLAAKVTSQLQDQFEFVIWRSLRNAPPLETLLSDLVPFLSQQQDIQPKPERLLHWLRTHRCLVVLDNVETIMQAGDRAGHYQPNYENYGDLLRLLGESAHQSCIILTSREKPAEVGFMEGAETWVRALSLTGSLEASLALLNTKELIGTEEQKRLLCHHYSYSPLALKIVAASIRSLFDGEISLFFKQDTLVFNGLRRLLDEQFERLSYLEQSVMYWLAINREWTSIDELLEDIVPTVSRANLLEGLESLCWRSLIEKQGGNYTQQPVVMEYVTSQFIELIATELITQKLNFFTRYALAKTTVKEFIRDSQIRLIVAPIVTHLQTLSITQTALQQKLLDILAILKRNPDSGFNYGAGNILTLCCYLHIDLTGYDFSNLAIVHAHLQKVDLHQVNFSHANFAKCIFMETFGGVFGAALSTDGKFLATGDSRCEVRLWELATGRLLLICKGHQDWVWSVAFNPDGTRLASCSIDGSIKLWDTATGQCTLTLTDHKGWIWSVAWSSDGDKLASAGADGTVRVWQGQTGQCLNVLPDHTDWVTAVTWHPHEQLLASSSQDQTIRIWNIAGQCLTVLQGHTDQIWSVAWSPTGKVLASGSLDRTIRLWDSKTGTCLKILQGHMGPVTRLTWSADGQKLAASTSLSHDVRVWDITTGQCLKILHGHIGDICSLVWSQDQKILASGAHDQSIRFWDTTTGDCVKTLYGYTGRIWCIAWSPDGKFLAAASEDRTIRIWQVNTQSCVNTLYGHTSHVLSLAWHPTQPLLVSGSADLSVRLWQVETGDCLKTWREHTSWVFSVGWNPEGTTIVSGGSDQMLKLWTIQQGCYKTIRVDTHQVWPVSWSSDGQKVAGSSGYMIKLWDVATWYGVADLKGHESQILSIAWSPDGQTLWSSDHSGRIKCWDLGRDRTLPQPSAKGSQGVERDWNAGCNQGDSNQGHHDQVWSLSCHPQGHVLASGSFDRTVRLWDIYTGKCLSVLQGHTDHICSVAFSPDGAWLASAGDDGTIRLWDSQTTECLHVLRPARPYEGMQITGVRGLTEAQKETLRALGAID